jgi:hypothetical protein
MDQRELAIREGQLRELHDELSNHARLRSGLRVSTIPQVKDWLKEKTVDVHVFTPSNLEGRPGSDFKTHSVAEVIALKIYKPHHST